jgi:uncharacterized protein (TIGR03086 family)
MPDDIEAPPVDELACAEAALAVLQTVVQPIARADMSRPTPCAEFDIAALTDHLMFSITTLGHAAGAEFPEGTAGSAAQEAVEHRIAVAARPALDAWHRRGLDGTVSLSVGPNQFPAKSAAGILALEFLVHAWDYAIAVGRDLEVPDALAEFVLEVAKSIITPEGRSAVGFDDPVELPGSATAFDQLLAYTGRTPAGA